MITIDTNVLVRLLIVDNSAQCDAARALVEKNRVLVLRTVLLETEWVLRSRFDIERAVIQRFFAGLADTSGIELEAESSTRRAIDAYAKGVDFADALHATAAAVPFHTFDARLLKHRKRIADSRILPVPSARTA
ncbi:MAG: type II toxin-antitoxin system VapC family toxin [Rhodanobacteraceae bacterium]